MDQLIRGCRFCPVSALQKLLSLRARREKSSCKIRSLPRIHLSTADLGLLMIMIMIMRRTTMMMMMIMMVMMTMVLTMRAVLSRMYYWQRPLAPASNIGWLTTFSLKYLSFFWHLFLQAIHFLLQIFYPWYWKTLRWLYMYYAYVYAFDFRSKPFCSQIQIVCFNFFVLQQKYFVYSLYIHCLFILFALQWLIMAFS